MTQKTTNQQKILVIAPSWIGDTVMAQALFKVLKKQEPNCIIDVFANQSLHPLLKCMPEVNNCLISPFNHGELRLVERFKLAKQLRKNFYTHAYVLPNSFKSALIPFWANIPLRTGWRGEFRYVLLNDIRLSPTTIPKMVERFVTLGIKTKEKILDPLPLPQLHVSPIQLEANLKKLNIVLPLKRPILALCPGAEYGETKRWPTAYFAEIAKIKKADGWDIWLLGGPKDQISAQEIQDKSNNICLDLTGKTNLEEAIGFLSLVTTAITNDSGLMHIAAALNRPLIAIYGSSSPKFTPPLTDRAKILSQNLPCSPCFKRQCPLKHLKCLYDLSPQMVLQAIEELI